MTQKLDVVVFGATGFTGKHTVAKIAEYYQRKNHQFTWGIAGRSQKKLQGILNECGKETLQAPIIIADVRDEKSLIEMSQKCRVIINCCGPFHFFGEPVVKACIETGTHYVDVSGEIQFIEKMQLKYFQEAREKGVYIISACGFESIPADLGVAFLQDNFRGTLNSVEIYLDEWEKIKGPVANYGTYESIIYLLAHAAELRDIRKKLFANPLPQLQPRLTQKKLPHKSPVTQKWSVPFQSTDRTVVRRSQRFFYENDHTKRPIQVETYFSLRKTLLSLLPLTIFGGLFLLLCKFSLGRKLLLKYPALCSGGNVTRGHLNEETIAKTQVSLTLYVQGWNEKLLEHTDEYSTPPNKAIAAEVSLNNPGYGATCTCLILSALTILNESEKMPNKGGVYPPGYAFAKTSLLSQLKDAGDIKFQLMFEKDI